MITHDLGVMAEIADDVVVMYAARVAEQAPVDNLFRRPHHPYTWGLLGSLPRLDVNVDRLTQIQGQPPSLLNPPRGCRFHPRCPYVMEICKEKEPELLPVSHDPMHFQRCHLDEETKDREAAKLTHMGQARVTTTETQGQASAAAAADRRRRAPRRRGSEEALPRHARDHLPEGSRVREGRRRRDVHGEEGRDARRRRGVGLREVDDGALHHAPARADGRPDHLRRARHHDHLARRDAADPARADDDLPGPVRVAEPAQARRLHHRRGARGAQARHARRTTSAACRSCSRSSASTRSTTTASRTSSPAASGSASASRGRSP